MVYGDIGTSPLYTIRECFAPGHGAEPTVANVLGVLSLIFWSLALVVVLKYLVFVMRADNHGEGGIMALIALISPAPNGNGRRRHRRWLILLGLFGTALLFADGMLYARDETGPVSLVRAAPERFSLHGRFTPPRRSRKQSWVHPVISGGRLFLREQNTLFCYDVANRPKEEQTDEEKKDSRRRTSRSR